jgi:hypothetical protein
MTSSTQQTLEDYQSVHQWRSSYARFWRGGSPEPEAFAALERFVTFCEATPDEIINEVLRAEDEGNRFMLRTRARRKYMGLIEQFEEQEGSRRIANGVRSFMIHNGIAMNPGILR